MQYTDEQIIAIDAMQEFFEGEPGIFVLSGYAGTGKTTCVREAMRRSYFRAPAMTAFTHKAVNVLSEIGPLHHAQYLTVHALCGARPHYSKGTKTFLPNWRRARWRDFDSLVVDEVSMLNSQMWGWLADGLYDSPIHIVCLGDPAQLLNPDDNSESPAFQQVNAHLQTIMRSDGIVQRAATTVREHLMQPMPVEIETDGNLVRHVSHDALLHHAFELFEGGEDAKVLAWRNSTVDWFNAQIRMHLYPMAPIAPQPGEHLTVVSTWAPRDGQRMLYAEQIIQVVESHLEQHHGLWAWRIKTLNNGEIWKLHPESMTQFQRQKMMLRAEGRASNRWAAFYELIEAFVSLRPPYATTVHKSQGSTYKHILAVDADIRCNPDPIERNRLRYVAFSRAAERLTVS